MRLNSKGMTTVEILMVFVIIGIISVGLFSMVSTYNTLQNTESAKEKVITFKNVVTREIEGDIIRRGLVSVNVLDVVAPDDLNSTFKAVLKFKDGTTKRLEVARYAFEGNEGAKEVHDEGAATATRKCLNVTGTNRESFSIFYGNDTDGETYDLPDLGESLNDCDHLTKDLRINMVDMYTKDNIFFVKIGFYHPDLGTKYYISIIAPINFDDISGAYSPDVAVCDISFTGTKGENGWYTSDGDVVLDTASSSGTVYQYGLVKQDTPYTGNNAVNKITVNHETTGEKYQGFVRMSNGSEAHCSLNLKIDKTPPSAPTINNNYTKTLNGHSVKVNQFGNCHPTYAGCWYDSYTFYQQNNNQCLISTCDADSVVATQGHRNCKTFKWYACGAFSSATSTDNFTPADKINITMSTVDKDNINNCSKTNASTVCYLYIKYKHVAKDEAGNKSKPMYQHLANTFCGSTYTVSEKQDKTKMAVWTNRANYLQESGNTLSYKDTGSCPGAMVYTRATGG